MSRLFKVFISLILVFGLVSSLNLVGFSQKKYNESPMLAELVKQGKLPPVEKRLPENPLVVEPVEEIGKYGGTWRFAMLGPGDISIYVPIFAEPLVKWNRIGNGIIPNVAEKWEVKRAYKEFVFYLRKASRGYTLSRVTFLHRSHPYRDTRLSRWYVYHHPVFSER